MKKRTFSIFPILLLGLLFLILDSCRKDTGSQQLPVIQTSPLSNIRTITVSTATYSGDISDDGGSEIIARGVCWSTNDPPTIADNKTSDGKGTGKYTSLITGLTPDTKYYVCGYATNNTGTGYGAVLSITTLPSSSYTVTDIDGNIYHTVTIGSQVWLRENLRTTRYSNGDSIPNDTLGTDLNTMYNPSYCIYDNDPENAKVYGLLYNWYAVMDSRNIAPPGWHVPSDYEWMTLINNSGGLGSAGAKLKEAGTSHWGSPNTGATNETGFTALPGGCRLTKNYGFYGLGSDGRWWSALPDEDGGSWIFCMFAYDKNVYDQINGHILWFSVRCVRD
jgi:uncharacterized protein (TIGR02145 family)